jgi:hypothetical protein
MTLARKFEVSLAVLLAVALIAGGIIYWQKQKAISIRGAIIIQDSDPRKQLPIAGATVSADDNLAAADSTSNPSGFFVLKLRKPIRKGHPMVLHFRHPQYLPFALKDIVSNRLYVIHLIPLPNRTPLPSTQTLIKVSNVRVRYTVRTTSELNVGSAVKTFEVENKGNVPCKHQSPCSPDGKWKAAIGSASLDAGNGNAFREVRVSCIAGPCPFTRIEADHVSQGGQTISVSFRNWSDTTTFLIEAEVFRSMESQSEHWSYPALFGQGLTFTLPPTAQSVSIEADLNAQAIIFPLGPSLRLSWATCQEESSRDSGNVYRCVPKPGYQFQ